MARIRGIKPDFFDDPVICDLSAEAALVFIGLWPQADRAGRLLDEPRRLKIRIRPMSKCDMNAILDELADAGLIIRYHVDGVALIQVKNFEKHQRPHHQEPSSVLPPVSCGFGDSPKSSGDIPMNPPVTVMETVTVTETVTEGVASRPRDAELLREAWNRLTTPPLPKCLALSKPRIKHARARLSERKLPDWEDVIRRINASAFCRGETDRGNWVASFDFLLRPDTALKVLEGVYDNRVAAVPRQAEPEVDWFEQCKQIHNGECHLDRGRHFQRVKMEAYTASQRVTA